MEDIKIVLDTPRWFYSMRNTDWKMKLIMASELKGLVELPKGWCFVVMVNVQEIAVRILPRRFRDAWMIFCSRVRSFLLTLEKPDVVISQGWFPPVSKKYKVLWETYFLPPQAGRGKREDFVRGGSNIWIRQLERYGRDAWRIAVRGKASVECLMAMYPEFSDKVLNLLFVQPEYDIAEDEFVCAKQRQSQLEIVFVGREAKRKGLDILLAALQKIRSSGICNFCFTVVSNMHDGKVKLPHEPWINYYRELPHADVLKLLRRAQFFAMPSRFESYGLVYLEAMANGCVTVVRDQDPQREFVDEGRAGVCVNERSVNEIADKISPLLADPSARIHLAMAGLKRYKTVFAQKVIRAQWLDALGGRLNV